MKQLLLFIAILCTGHFAAAQTDSASNKTDTLPAIQLPINRYDAAWKQLAGQNHYLNTGGAPVVVTVKFKKPAGTDAFFYLLLTLVLILGLLRFFYARYFNTIFRVFFNTSLRQGQLTDQLLQSRLPSLLFNSFFILSAGSFIFFLMTYYQAPFTNNKWLCWMLCVLAVGVVYVTKYAVLKFTGWVTGYSTTTDTYVFIIFLISKIIGIVLLPFTILITFAGADIAATAALVSVLFIGLLLLLRFFRSYGLLQKQLKIDRFHFILYLAGVEIIPLLLIYRGLMFLLQKNL
ncbi:MAG: DUF4271 domain-containing protein [Ferruginibacter sp.]